MAQQDYAGLLTGLDTRPRNPMQGLDREGRMAQRAQGFANRMTGGMLQAAGQDSRTPQQQANAAIGSLKLETDDPVEQQANIEAVRKVDATRAQMLASMYDKRNKERAATDLAASQFDSQQKLRQQQVDEQIRANEAAELRNEKEDERQAVERSAQTIRQEKGDARSERAMQLQEEAAARTVAADKTELDKATLEAVARGNRRALYIDAARTRGLNLMADALEKGMMQLEDAETLLYKSQSSNAQLSAPSDTEIEAMTGILDSPAFKDTVVGLPTGTIISDSKKEGRRAVMYKAKQLMLRDRNLTIEKALEDATAAIKELYVPMKDPVPVPKVTPSGKVNPDGTFDASNVSLS